MCHDSNKMLQTTFDRRNGTTKSRQIRTFGEEETFKLLSISEAETIKQREITEKLRKNILGERDSYSRQNYVAEILSKKQIPGQYPSLDIRDPYWRRPENICKCTKEHEN